MTSPDPTGPVLPARAVRELAAATAALVSDHDAIGAATELLSRCARAVGAEAGGIVLTAPEDAGLEFLAATTLLAQHLELYQVQTDEGPAVDCIRSGHPVRAFGLDEIAGRWSRLTDSFRAAGYAGVCASPMTFQGSTLGAVNLFFAQAADGEDVDDLVVQAFTDIATVLVVHAGLVPAAQVVARTAMALDQRAVIERAKGVLASTDGIAVEAAFEKLLMLAETEGRPLTAVAESVVRQAVRSGPTT